LLFFIIDRIKTPSISIPSIFLARSSAKYCIEKAPIITAGKPTINPSIRILLSGLFFSKNLIDAPTPNKTVETLCVAKATGKLISYSNRIAGNCIIPAPPPENAENKFDKKEIKNNRIYSKP
jgi:hypothetical protein